MKKFVVLMLVLCLAASASAILQLSVNGGPNPGQITLAPSDWIELDVHADAGLIGGQFSIVLSNSQGLLDPSAVQFAPEYCSSYVPYNHPAYSTYSPYDLPWRLTPTAPPTPHEVTVDGGNFSSASVLPQEILWNLMFHCEEATDVEILLYSNLLVTGEGDIVAGTLLDSLYVEQIPEPMTLGLLGLGGLLLRRRK